MLDKVKYIRTKYDQIIMFPETIQHDAFRSFYPVSAGFVSIDKEGCKCYGKSVSLNLTPDCHGDLITDVSLINKQILRL